MWYSNVLHWKIFGVICCALRLPKVTKITISVSIVTCKQARWPPLLITFIVLSCNNRVVERAQALGWPSPRLRCLDLGCARASCLFKKPTTLKTLQPTHSFQDGHGTGRPEPSQRPSGLATVVQAHRTLQPLQLSTGWFCENLQVAGKRQKARGLLSQERQRRVVAWRVDGDG